MSDIAVYMIANLVVEDAAEYRKYEQGFFPILKSLTLVHGLPPRQKQEEST